MLCCLYVTSNLVPFPAKSIEIRFIVIYQMNLQKYSLLMRGITIDSPAKFDHVRMRNIIYLCVGRFTCVYRHSKGSSKSESGSYSNGKCGSRCHFGHQANVHRCDACVQETINANVI